MSATSLTAAFYLAVNYVIPSILAPRLVSSINRTFKGAASLSVGRVAFNFQKGLFLEEVELTAGSARLFSVKEVDIALDLNALIKRELIIKEVLIKDTELTVARNSKGNWNFSPLLHYYEASDAGKGPELSFKTIKFSGSIIRFADNLHKHNSIDRSFVNGKVVIENVDNAVYLAKISANDPAASHEAVELKLKYDAKKKAIEGKIKANTKYLERYWAYYLDDLFFPWHLKAKDVTVDGGFSLAKDTLTLDARYTVKKGVLRYGTIEVFSDAVIDQKLKLVKGNISKDSSSLNIRLKKVVVPLDGDKLTVNDLTCSAQVTNKGIVFKKIHGRAGPKAFILSGRYTFDHPRNIYLMGKYGDAYGMLGIRLFSLNTAEAFVKGKTKGAAFEIHGYIPDIKELLVDIKMKALLSLPVSSETVNASIQIGDYDINVRVDFSASLKGYLKKTSTLNGDADVKVAYLSALSPDTGTFNFKMTVVDGMFEGTLPKTPFYGGSIYGLARTDIKKWGVETHIDNFDLSDFSRISPKYKNLKGKFDGSVVCVADWNDHKTARGGGYVDLRKANLQNVPIFSNAEAGVASLEAGFTMPEIESIIGNFEIKDEKITLQNMLCKAYKLSLYLAGSIDFDMDTHVTAGVKFIAGFWKTLRQVFIPVTIPFDIAASSVKISISGKYPDLKQTTSIQEMQWMNIFFDAQSEPDPQRYKLDDYWKENKD